MGQNSQELYMDVKKAVTWKKELEEIHIITPFACGPNSKGPIYEEVEEDSENESLEELDT